MPWNIAQAKQHFSEVVKQSAEQPQLIYNRNRPVAALISADDYAAFEEWRKMRAKPYTLAEEFAEFRQIMQEEGYEGLPQPPRTTRTNAFAPVLQDESGELSR